jgi:hypothetical protein
MCLVHSTTGSVWTDVNAGVDAKCCGRPVCTKINGPCWMDSEVLIVSREEVVEIRREVGRPSL